MLDEAKRIAQQIIQKWYINEVEEDLKRLSKIIEDFGAKVLRPTPYGSTVFSTQNWSSTEIVYIMQEICIW